MTLLSLSKHHGLGNDFLVLLDPHGAHPVDASLARALCDRHRGVGADGLIRVTAGTGGADVTMELRNADGGPAEMSGNGIRCLAQAVLDAGLAAGPELTVATAAGLRRVTVHAAEGAVMQVSVDMGQAKVGPDEPQPMEGRGVRPVDMGNPHVVVWGPGFSTDDVLGMGAEVDRRTPGGTNVEFVTVGPGAGELTMRVWERGVGETQACGTGACAAAAAAHEWGLVGARVVVHQPGGDAEVELRAGGVVLTGPSVRIARIEVDVA
ncbi:MAG TPA: diaminopimelate epimerase [Acidimicrobiales bacterium]|nr:diaminopimelate epimerase [Acidimicrobiales bacterium]